MTSSIHNNFTLLVQIHTFIMKDNTMLHNDNNSIKIIEKKDETSILHESMSGTLYKTVKNTRVTLTGDKTPCAMLTSVLHETLSLSHKYRVFMNVTMQT